VEWLYVEGCDMSKELAQVEALKTLMIIYAQDGMQLRGGGGILTREKQDELDVLEGKLDEIMKKIEELAGIGYTLQ